MSTAALLVTDDPSISFIGCDVGGTATQAVLTNGVGDVLKRSHGKAANPHVVGFEVSVQVISEVLQTLLIAKLGFPAAVTVCVSGGESSFLRKRYISKLRDLLGLEVQTRIFVTHDAVAPLGLVLSTSVESIPRGDEDARALPVFATFIAGTGSVAARFVTHYGSPNGDPGCVFRGNTFWIEMKRKCGGWGPVLGEKGSAYAISVQTLSLALRVWDGMDVRVLHLGRPNVSAAVVEGDRYAPRELKAFAEDVLRAAVGHYRTSLKRDRSSIWDVASQIDELVALVYRQATGRGAIAGLTRVFAGMAAEGNALCVASFREAGEEVGALLSTALALDDLPTCDAGCDVVVCGTGGVLNAWEQVPAFADGFRRATRSLAPSRVRVCIPKAGALEPEGPSCDSVRASEHAAFACAHLGALACSRSNDQWTRRTRSYLLRVSEPPL